MSTKKSPLAPQVAFVYTGGMDKEQSSRKTVSLPLSMWDDIADYRFQQRIASEAEAIRRLLQSALENAKPAVRR